jgi:single-stranded-DNA-specific exonuclease
MRPWKLRPLPAPSPELLASVGGRSLVTQLLIQRGLTTPQQVRAFLEASHYTPAPPSALFGLERAAQTLHRAIQHQQNFLIWGDFDVDGQTSTSLLVTALYRLVGEERVRFHVPNRFSESHGIRPHKLLEKLEQADIPLHVLLTCDTGIAEVEAVHLAKERGLTVVITDHHDLPPELSELAIKPDALDGVVFGVGLQQQPSVRYADAIVNPKFQPPGDPLRTLPGVGVAYKLIQRLYALCGIDGEESELLDLVALGIVADVAEQVHDARYLLQLGLERLRNTRRTGLQALMQNSRINPATLSAESIGFQLGPRMNALGRLEDATLSVELLTTRDAIRAGQLAAKLERLNNERRLLTSQIHKAALEMLEREPKLLEYHALVLAHPGWHAGVVGIVASRLVEEFGKPAVLLLNPPGEMARGSARSVPGVDIGAAIAGCSPLLLSHGGHPGAAGVTLLSENIDRFRRELHRQIELNRSEEVETALLLDAELTLAELSVELTAEINRLAPFGNGNPQPQFLSRQLTVVEDRRLGREGAHRKLTVRQKDGPALSVVWFNGADAELPAQPLDLAYTLNINEYKGERSLQLMFVDVRAAQPADEASLAPPLAKPTPVLHDLRRQPLRASDLPSGNHVFWYAEGVLLDPALFAPRTLVVQSSQRLAPGAATLVLWSIPPSPELLHWLVERVQAQAIYLCAQDCTDDSVDGVVRQVAAMCNYALQRDCLLDLGRMAARMGASESVIRLALLSLQAGGQVSIDAWLEGDQVKIQAGSGQRNLADIQQLEADFKSQLAEVRAYRRFFERAKLEELKLGEGR